MLFRHFDLLKVKDGEGAKNRYSTVPSKEQTSLKMYKPTNFSHFPLVNRNKLILQKNIFPKMWTYQQWKRIQKNNISKLSKTLVKPVDVALNSA